MRRKQMLIAWVATTMYSDVKSESRQKQFAREYLNGLNNLQFLELLDEVCPL